MLSLYFSQVQHAPRPDCCRLTAVNYLIPLFARFPIQTGHVRIFQLTAPPTYLSHTPVCNCFSWSIFYVKTQRADAADPLPSLHPRDGVSYPPGSSDVALWGTLVVYRSRLEAWKSLSDDDKEGQYVRLVKVAINKQLSKLLVPGKELGGPTAELFLRVAPTCPAYYAL